MIVHLNFLQEMGIEKYTLFGVLIHAYIISAVSAGKWFTILTYVLIDLEMLLESLSTILVSIDLTLQTSD